MSSSTDTRLIVGSRFVTYCQMGALCICVAALLLFVGCNQEQQAVDLYVDAVMLKEFNENEMAVEKLNSAVQLNKSFSLAYSLLGEIYQEMNDYEKSADSYENATKLNPWSFEDYFNLGRVYQIMEKFAQAIKAYARACEIKPDHLEAHVGAARSYYEIEDYNNALIYGEWAEQIDPNISEIQKILGDIYKSREDYHRAIRSYKRALEADSNNPEIMVSLAVVYLRTNRDNSAKELLTSVIQIQPDNNIAYRYLGYCYLRLNAQATASHKSTLETDSNNLELLTSLKEDADKAASEAIASYNKAIEISDKDWEAYRGLGVAYMLRALSNKDETLKAKIREKAVQQWRLSLEIESDQPNRERLLKLIRYYSE